MRVLVCGGRDYTQRDCVFRVLDALALVESVEEVIHGAARGADSLAGKWAQARGVKETPVPANWYPQPGKLDRGAGFKRNRAMLKLRPDLVVAFPGGNGTADMVQTSRDAGIRVMEV